MISSDQIRNCLYAIRKSELYNGEYEELHRHYHTWQHIETLFSMIESQVRPDHEKSILYTVAFFHDMIYDTNKPENEINSAKHFNEYIKKIDRKSVV